MRIREHEQSISVYCKSKGHGQTSLRHMAGHQLGAMPDQLTTPGMPSLLPSPKLAARSSCHSHGLYNAGTRIYDCTCIFQQQGAATEMSFMTPLSGLYATCCKVWYGEFTCPPLVPPWALLPDEPACWLPPGDPPPLLPPCPPPLLPPEGEALPCELPPPLPPAEGITRQGLDAMSHLFFWCMEPLCPSRLTGAPD